MEPSAPAPTMFAVLGETDQAGIPLDAPLVVPEGQVGVIARYGAPACFVAAGSHVMVPALLPTLRERPPTPRYRGRALDAGCYLLPAGPISIPWSVGIRMAQASGTALRRFEITGTMIVQVVDPCQFVASLYRHVRDDARKSTEMRSFKLYLDWTDSRAAALDNLVPAGNALAATLATTVLSDAALKMEIPANASAVELTRLHDATGAELAGQLSEFGIQLKHLTVDRCSAAQPVACEFCKVSTAPTTAAAFRCNIGMFITRFELARQGAFCRNCALKWGLGYSAINLICGWWGLISLIVAPIYLVLNLIVLTAALKRLSGATVSPY
ncbi:MAG TPA: hypothetical protein VKT77_17770 [Chthonomonadaceae bacterium]|nr:hypothetical protein [Chthonomonadaceae bacterium]